MPDFKECPFCGGSDIEVQKESCCGKHQCWCNDCFCAGPLQLFLEEAVESWNNRANINEGKVLQSAIANQQTHEAIALLKELESDWETSGWGFNRDTRTRVQNLLEKIAQQHHA